MLCPMIVGVPAKIFVKVSDGSGHLGWGNGNMMLKPIAADVVKQVLQVGDPNNTIASKSGQRIVGKLTFSYIGSNNSVGIICAYPGEAKGARFDPTRDCSIGVFFSYSTGNNVLITHGGIFHEVPGEIAAVESYSFVKMIPIVVIPVHYGTRFLRRCL